MVDWRAWGLIGERGGSLESVGVHWRAWWFIGERGGCGDLITTDHLFIRDSVK